ncbi:MAG: hypothetical protein Q4E10_02360 [Porphyromonas sp.]|nr:hypothetical protein [Porphyromonas sp.]
MGSKKQTKMELFIELAHPNKNGESEWVDVNRFTGKYEALKLGNGFSWGRKHSPLERKYIIEVDRSQTKGNGIDRIRLNGFNGSKPFNQHIRADIRDYYKNANCVMLGLRGTSVNTRIEIDHKDGRKDNDRISDINGQKITDFQPLSKAANDAKRQICKECKLTNKRWDAKNLLGNPFSFYEGDEDYKGTCVGCYQYDPVAYRYLSAKRLIEITSHDLMRKLYSDLPNDLLDGLVK